MNQLIPVPFYGDTLFLTDHDGLPYTPLKPIAESLGLSWGSQVQKIKNYGLGERLGCVDIDMPSPGGIQRMICISVRKLPAYLFGINANKVRPDLRDKLIRYQNECDEVLWRHWTGLNAAEPHTASPELLEILKAMQAQMQVLGVQTQASLSALAQALDVTQRYTALLERHQKQPRIPCRPVTREDEAAILELKAQGMNHADIARHLGISRPAVSMIAHGKYHFRHNA
ncbi:phage antirepressor N-terminal domain-containing protein [Methylocaldum gracile subsp. desertum]|uniref:phage antirepressor N-terminal domain-containing protein n=1 Tax=Methylocaldum sp. GT1BW TaxID=3438964 RepID=UPI003DA05B7D